MSDLQSTASAPLTVAINVGANMLAEHRDFVLSFIERSDAKRQPLMDLRDEVWENYMVAPAGDLARRRITLGQGLGSSTTAWHDSEKLGRARLKDPETHVAIETLCAQATGLLFGSRDYLQAIPVGADDPEKARLISRLLMAVLEQPGFFRTVYQLFKNAFIFGTSIVEMGWETRSRTQWVPRPVIDSLGRLTGARELVPTEVAYRDRPLLVEIDGYDFYPDPSGTRIQHDMVGAAKRFTVTTQEAMRLMEAGTYPERDAVKRAIARAAEGNRVRPGTGRMDNREQEAANLLPPPFGLMTGFEYQGEYPGRTSDGFSNRVITVLNGEVVRSYGIPYTDGNIRWKELVVNPVNGRFWGLSPAEVIRFLQDSTDHFMMSLQDATNAAIRGPLLVGRGFGGDPEALRNPRQNEVIEVTDPTKVQRVPQSESVLALAMQELANRRLTMREAAGSNGQMLPMPSSGARGGATEISEIVRLASQRSEAMISLVEREDFPHIGRTLHTMLRQFVDPSDELVAIYGGERFSMTLDDIDVDADVRFVGSRSVASKFQRTAAMKEAISIIGTNPEILDYLPELVVRHLRDNLDIQDADAHVARAMMALDTARKAAAAAEAQAAGKPVPGSGSESNFGTQAGETERGGQRLA